MAGRGRARGGSPKSSPRRQQQQQGPGRPPRPQTRKRPLWPWLVLVVAVVLGLGGAGRQALGRPKWMDAVAGFIPEAAVIAVEDALGVAASMLSGAPGRRASENSLEPRGPGAAQDAQPASPLSFTVHFNGDGAGAGTQVTTSDFSGLDELIETACLGMDVVLTNVSGGDPEVHARVCRPSEGALLFSHEGLRMRSFLEVSPGSRTYIVPQGVLFVWPLGKVGSYLHPAGVESPVVGRPIRLRQLSLSPRVFTVENFMSAEEIDVILDYNREALKPSEVGFAGRRDSTRTSSTAWDFNSWAARKVQRRSFDLLSVEFRADMGDAVQVLRYNPSEWYKPHTDWFKPDGYDGSDPKVGNGTNRFATVFLYLTDVEEGGHTVFPLSTTHEGYSGEQLVEPGTAERASYISQEDAEWVCNSSSTALRSSPKAGTAVLFYSQGPDGALDNYSLHGGCPVLAGTKYSANVWVWNRPKPSKDQAKDGKPKADASINVQFFNARDAPVLLFWDDGTDEMVFQLELEAGAYGRRSTYHGHRFQARDKETKEAIVSFVAHDDMLGAKHVFTIPTE